MTSKWDIVRSKLAHKILGVETTRLLSPSSKDLLVHIESDEENLSGSLVILMKGSKFIGTRRADRNGDVLFENVLDEPTYVRVSVRATPSSLLEKEERERKGEEPRILSTRGRRRPSMGKEPIRLPWFSYIINQYQKNIESLESRNAETTLSKYWKFTIEKLYDSGTESRLRTKETLFRNALEIPSKAILDTLCVAYMNESSTFGRLLALKKLRREQWNRHLEIEISKRITPTLRKYFRFISMWIKDNAVPDTELTQLEKDIDNFFWDYDTRYVYYIKLVSRELVSKAKKNLADIEKSACHMEAARLLLDLNRDLTYIASLRDLLSIFSKIPPQ